VCLHGQTPKRYAHARRYARPILPGAVAEWLRSGLQSR
jgi:hypothetical protein